MIEAVNDGEGLVEIGDPVLVPALGRALVGRHVAGVERLEAVDREPGAEQRDADRGLQRFVERMTELNRGRAFFTTPQNLGDFVLVDFIEQKRQMLRGRRAS